MEIEDEEIGKACSIPVSTHNTSLHHGLIEEPVIEIGDEEIGKDYIIPAWLNPKIDFMSYSTPNFKNPSSESSMVITRSVDQSKKRKRSGDEENSKSIKRKNVRSLSGHKMEVKDIEPSEIEIDEDIYGWSNSHVSSTTYCCRTMMTLNTTN
ncbi:Uncharacterized protein Fot_13969 [Forsythia ovata]|uniref:Uncharacterized protein n=1 Tax=Forsythia ovata TaxID=205694 RepID=A0ABD1W510_9LAMI